MTTSSQPIESLTQHLRETRSAQSASPVEPFYFDSPRGKLFAAYFAPADTARRCGVVLCNGFGKEFEICRTPLVRYGLDLAARGYPSLRFDYAGYGDSAGAFEDATISTMCDDVERGIDALAARAPIDEVCLVGVRFGALVAALVASRRKDVKRLALWAPVIGAWDYLYGELRKTLAMQTLIFENVRFTRDQIVANVLAGTPSLADGYDLNIIDDGFPLGRGLVEEAKRTDLLATPPKLDASVLILHVDTTATEPPARLRALAADLAHGGARCTIDVAVEPVPFWQHGGRFVQRLPAVFDMTTTWLEG